MERPIRRAAVHATEPEGAAIVLTYGEFFDHHYLPHVKSRKRSWARDEQLYRLRIQTVFGSSRLDQIPRYAIQSFHSSLAAEGLAPATANHHVKLLRSSLNLARRWGMLGGENPASGVPMLFEDNKVERYLDDVELQQLLHVLRTDENRPVCNVALFLLSTGCRLNEALSATWSDIDLQRRAFTIQATHTKSRRLRSVPLNDSAVDVLMALGTRETGGRLFVSARTGYPLTTIARSWDRLRKNARLPGLRLHDLRHQFASFLVNDGRTLYEVQALLGHSTSKVTERYAHLSTERLREAAASVSVRLLWGADRLRL